MAHVVRAILATVVGLVIGGAVNMGIILVGSRLVPPPAGVDVNDPASINAHLGEYAPIQFAVPFLAHALGTLVGAIVATLVAGRGRRVPAFVVGAMFLLGGIAMVRMLPNTPTWFIALDLGVAYLPMAWLGHRIVARPAACATAPDDGLSPRQRALRDMWEEHMKGEFATKSVEETMATMVEPAHVNHVPTMTGGTGFPAISSFYGAHFIPKMPPDVKVTPVSRTIGDTQIVDEFIFSFTHTVEMDWMLPGIAPTGKRVEVPFVAIIGFKDGKVQHEHIYWDQASVLVQLGLLDASRLPVAGAETARKVVDPSLPSNGLIERAAAGG